MGQYDCEIDTALQLIEQYGQVVTWRTKQNGTPNDPNQPWKPSAAIDTDRSVSIVFLPQYYKNKTSSQYQTGTEVPTGFLAGLMGQVDFEPKLKDVVIRDGKLMEITSVDPFAPNGDVIFYELEFKL